MEKNRKERKRTNIESLKINKLEKEKKVISRKLKKAKKKNNQKMKKIREKMYKERK